MKPFHSVIPSPRYVYSAGWGHYFSLLAETQTRWVVDRTTERLVFAKARAGANAGAWIDLTVAQSMDLLDSLKNVNDVFCCPQEHDLGAGDELPEWATLPSELLPFTVIGSHENTGNLFVLHVLARDSLSAFGAAASELVAADADIGSTWLYVALPGHQADERDFSLPGEGVVDVSTVLDPEQADVFGLPEPAPVS